MQRELPNPQTNISRLGVDLNRAYTVVSARAAVEAAVGGAVIPLVGAAVTARCPERTGASCSAPPLMLHRCQCGPGGRAHTLPGPRTLRPARDCPADMRLLLGGCRQCEAELDCTCCPAAGAALQAFNQTREFLMSVYNLTEDESISEWSATLSHCPGGLAPPVQLLVSALRG